MNKIELNTINTTNQCKYMYMRKDLKSGATNNTYSNSKLFLEYLKVKYSVRKILMRLI